MLTLHYITTIFVLANLIKHKINCYIWSYSERQKSCFFRDVQEIDLDAISNVILNNYKIVSQKCFLNAKTPIIGNSEIHILRNITIILLGSHFESYIVC